MHRPEEFESGSGVWTEQSTIADMNNPADPIVADADNGTLDPAWMDCLGMKELVQFLAIAADGVRILRRDLHGCLSEWR